MAGFWHEPGAPTARARRPKLLVAALRGGVGMAPSSPHVLDRVAADVVAPITWDEGDENRLSSPMSK